LLSESGVRKRVTVKVAKGFVTGGFEAKNERDKGAYDAHAEK